MQHAVDKEQGGFVGRIGGANRKHPQAPKGAVLNSRFYGPFQPRIVI
jgi:mannobiose 2-epimerase